MLTVAEKTDGRKNGYIVWLCKCDCGGEIKLDTRCLQRGTVTDCGCVSVVKPGMLDLTGQRFGKLLCIRPYEEKDIRGNTQWVCQCDCGKTCITSVHKLRSGYKKSCGCLSHPPLKDYLGKRFGKLTVIEYGGKWDGMHRWKCRCDCGNETIVGQTLLQSGKTKSCGCLSRSKKTDIQDNPFYRSFIDGTNVGILEARMKNPPIKSNTSGYNGVYKNTNGTWTAQITFKKKTYYLGSFSDIRDAVIARKKGEEVIEDFLHSFYSMSNKQEIRRKENANTVIAVRNRILALCSEREITIKQLAGISMLSPSSIKDILNGKNQNPKLITIKKICDGLGITLGEFFSTPEFDGLEQEIK